MTFSEWMKKFVILAVLPVLLSCQERNVQPQKPMFGDILKAFDLLDADGRKGTYVIAEDPGNQNFVQFGIMKHSGFTSTFPALQRERRILKLSTNGRSSPNSPRWTEPRGDT